MTTERIPVAGWRQRDAREDFIARMLDGEALETSVPDYNDLLNELKTFFWRVRCGHHNDLDVIKWFAAKGVYAHLLRPHKNGEYYSVPLEAQRDMLKLADRVLVHMVPALERDVMRAADWRASVEMRERVGAALYDQRIGWDVRRNWLQLEQAMNEGRPGSGLVQ